MEVAGKLEHGIWLKTGYRKLILCSEKAEEVQVLVQSGLLIAALGRGAQSSRNLGIRGIWGLSHHRESERQSSPQHCHDLLPSPALGHPSGKGIP